MQCFQNLGRVFLAKRARFVVGPEIQFAQLLQFQIEQVERFLDEAAFDEFLGDDAAERLNVERLALGEVFDSPGLLCGTTGYVLATPCDFFFRRRDELCESLTSSLF